MISHTMVGTNDFDKSKTFYDAVLGALGHIGQAFGKRAFYQSKDGGPGFGIGAPANGEPATHANGGTIGFTCKSKAEVDAFHAAGLANGGTCEGPPGIRPQAPKDRQYGAYLRDPDGNKICTFGPAE